MKLDDNKDTAMKNVIGGLPLACLTLWSQTAMAAWPSNKPIELVVDFTPGCGKDVMARVLVRPA